MEAALADTADLRVWDLPVRVDALAAGDRDRRLLVDRRCTTSSNIISIAAMRSCGSC